MVMFSLLVEMWGRPRWRHFSKVNSDSTVISSDRVGILANQLLFSQYTQDFVNNSPAFQGI